MQRTITVNGDRFALYLSEKKIRSRVKRLAKQVSREYKGKVPIFIGILNGSFIFMGDLIRYVTIDCEVDFLKLSSYGDAKISSGSVRMLKEVDCQVQDRDIIVVEDIVDSGLSVDFIRKLLLPQNPRSFKIISLLYKKGAQKISVPIDYVGFRIPNDFVIGYGLDYGQKVRNLRGIYRLTAERTAR